MRAVAYVNKFLRARGGVVTTLKNLDSLLGLKPVLVPRKFLGRFTPLHIRPLLTLESTINDCVWHCDYCNSLLYGTCSDNLRTSRVSRRCATNAAATAYV